jgi:hypothetical protein
VWGIFNLYRNLYFINYSKYLNRMYSFDSWNLAQVIFYFIYLIPVELDRNGQTPISSYVHTALQFDRNYFVTLFANENKSQLKQSFFWTIKLLLQILSQTSLTFITYQIFLSFSSEIKQFAIAPELLLDTNVFSIVCCYMFNILDPVLLCATFSRIANKMLGQIGIKVYTLL